MAVFECDALALPCVVDPILIKGFRGIEGPELFADDEVVSIKTVGLVELLNGCVPIAFCKQEDG